MSLTTRAPRFVLLAVAPALLAACSGATARMGASAPSTSGGELPMCRALGPLMDLRAGLRESPPAELELGHLVALDHTRATLAVARARLGNAGELSAFDARLSELGTKIAGHRAQVAARLDALRESYAAVEHALDEALVCKGVDLRAPSAAPFASAESKRRAALAPKTQESDAQSKKNRAILQSKECAPIVRLGSAITSLDVTSKLSTAGASGHLKELAFDGAFAKTRDRLASALNEHSGRLADFEAAHRSNPGPATDIVNDVARLQTELDDVGKRCLGAMDRSVEQVVEAGDHSPRRVTVLVRPKWPEPYAAGQSSTGVFGSGVLVRWKLPSGRTELRVVTNAHVLGGAESADLLEADRVELEAEAPDKAKATKPWTGTLLRATSDDDIVILRVEPNGAALPPTGLALRLAPPKEQEAVTAAGFPGLGAHPSFQASAGTVSNASLRAGSGPFGAYLQHTAAIDPGNSGGPLLDAEGRLLGINTIKVFGRESVGLAIPTSRVQLALVRADDHETFVLEHAEALCNAFLSLVESDRPSQELVDRLSLHLDPNDRTVDAEASFYRARIRGEQDGPLAAARAVAYARLRARLEGEGGVARLTTCGGPAAATGDKFTAAFSTRAGKKHTLTMAPEDGVLRVRAVE